MTYELGVDVSKWQTPEKVDWPRIRAAGYKFVIARHAYGTLTDTSFYRHAIRALYAGMEFMAYQYLVKHQPAGKQAELAVSIARDLPGPYVLDVEMEGLTKPLIDEWIRVYTASKLPLMIYTSKYAWGRCYGSNYHGYHGIPLWVANYTTASAPALPFGWKTWAYWQFTDKGRINGFDGDLDLNRRNTAQ